MSERSADGLEAIAKAIYEGSCSEGFEECFSGTDWTDLPEPIRDGYRRIANGVLSALQTPQAPPEQMPAERMTATEVLKRQQPG